jgi:CRISPR-associated protein Csm1
MSIQVFLEGKLQGVSTFLAGSVDVGERELADRVFAGRCAWAGLLMEILPRALLAEFKLHKMLLGASGGGQFLLVLPEEFEEKANEFLEAAAAGIARLSGDRLSLTWASTENLGDWSIVRRRLRDGIFSRTATPAAGCDLSWFTPFQANGEQNHSDYFASTLGAGLIEQRIVGWSPEHPGKILSGEGKHSWILGSEPDQILLTRHVALSDDGHMPATTATLASRSEGRKVWGVLRGVVDNLGVRFRRAQSIEEHVQLSVLYKQFFAGELEVLSSMPEFWRKVTVLHASADEFAAFGSWDALIQLARELQRLFRLFSDQSLKDYPGGEGKTISMALALARSPGDTIIEVYNEAGRSLEDARCSWRDCFSLFGRVLEWRQLSGAADLKDTMVHVAQEFGGSTQFLRELSAFYRDEVFSPASVSRRKEGELEKPWRLHRRVLRVLPMTRDRELERLRSSLIVELIGKNASQVKLRPAGRVALEWARLLTEA